MGRSVASIEWQAVKFPLNLLNFAEEKNTIGPLEKRTLYDADKRMAFILLYHKVTNERINTEY